MKNANLNTAKRDKNDEFYTLFEDVENEVKHYRDRFFGKVVYCNCDNPFESNFFKYFVVNFNNLGLKQLISTCFSPYKKIATNSLMFDDVSEKIVGNKTPYKAVVNTVDDTMFSENNTVDFDTLFKNSDNELSVLEGDGDFRSEEAKQLLECSDIVVTNPPFSLFRDFIATITQFDVQFLVIGNLNAVAYKDIFPLIKDNKMSLGFNSPQPKDFIVPNIIEGRKNFLEIDENTIISRLGNCVWYTNFEFDKQYRTINLTQYYDPEKYPKYDNYNIIEVSKVSEIPKDYEHIMGVPVTFIGKHNPDQFSIVGCSIASDFNDPEIEVTGGDRGCFINGKETYKRVFIKNNNPEKM